MPNKIEFSTDFSQWIFFNPTYWKEVIGYLWLPNLDDFKVLLNDNNVSVWSYSCFIIGKIFIAFGIYQTISAFRKYGKQCVFNMAFLNVFQGCHIL